MTSRASFFNFHAFRKDVRRFAPLWGLYSVGLVLIYLVLMTEDSSYYRASNLAESVVLMALLNCGYAFLAAQLLFGDLFSSRLCNALHAMPLRRETWFGTHVAAGIAFSVVPNLVFAVVSFLTMALGQGDVVPLYWLLGVTLQYLLFFGMSVFCIMLTGSRFAAAVVYGLMNFLSMLVWWLVDSLYEPLLTGVRVHTDPFTWLSPLVSFLDRQGLIEVVSRAVKDVYGGITHRYTESVILTGEIFWYAGYAAAGVALLAAALLLYKKRALESAGDFMAFRATEPVLLVIYTMAMGGFFHLFNEILGDGAARYIFLAVGLAVGYFTGTMLLERTARVFRLRVFLGFVLLVGVFILSLALTALDPLGITRWVPDEEDVVSVNLSTRFEHYGYSEGELDITDPDAIREIISVHEYQIGRTYDDELDEMDVIIFNACIEYTLKDGTTRTRFYEVNVLSQAGQKLAKYYSDFAYVMGFPESQIPEMAEQIDRIYSQDYQEWEYGYITAEMDMEALLRAIAADCSAGNMIQIYAYHGGNRDYATYLEIGFRVDDEEDSYMNYRYLNVFPESENTLRWMRENGIYDPLRTDDAEGKY